MFGRGIYISGMLKYALIFSAILIFGAIIITFIKNKITEIKIEKDNFF